jgi:hypothetical protein
MINDDERRQIIEVLRRPQALADGMEQRIRAIEDRLEIEGLIHRYGYLCDFRLWDELMDLYTDDIERVLGGTLTEYVKGKAALLPLYQNLPLPNKDGVGGAPPPEQLNTYEVKHLITGIVVNVHGDEASAIGRYTISAEGIVDGEQRRGTHDGSYEFRFRRTPKGWKFCYMLVVSGNAGNPMFQRSGS